jgi:gluconate 2-dehydrogenase gamma chain
MADDAQKVITRRDLLKGFGVVGAAAAAPAAALGSQVAQAGSAAQVAPTSTREALEALTAAESDTLEAIVARLIPSDANGPGAKEARAARYIDRALGGALSGSREAYRAGLAALDRYARSSRGSAFHELQATDQDSVLIDVELGAATGFPGSSAQFFNMVRTHTIQGTFSDPFYGGNAGFVGWDLIGYPGIRTTVTAQDQQMLERQQLKPNHRSAYDNDMFNKATAGLEPHGATTHGD